MGKTERKDGLRDSQPRITRPVTVTGEHPVIVTPGLALLGYAKAALANILFEAARGDHEEVSVVGARRGLRRIASTGHRMQRLLGDLADLADVESNRLRLERRRTDLVRLVVHVLDGLTPENRRLIRFEARDHSTVMVDAERIERVIATVLDNALNRAVDTEVSVRLDRKGDSASLTITDHGPGLTAGQTRSVFDARSLDTGMPLYVGKRLIEAHGGRIAVDSVPGRGTWFSIELPVGGQR